VRGRLPGARLAGLPSLSQNICPRVLRQKPSSGITGELCSQPPDGVRNHVAVPVDHVEVAGIAPPFDLRPGLALHGGLADAERPGMGEVLVAGVGMQRNRAAEAVDRARPQRVQRLSTYQRATPGVVRVRPQRRDRHLDEVQAGTAPCGRGRLLPEVGTGVRTVWLKAERVTPRRVAAVRKLRLSATAINAVRSASSHRRIAFIVEFFQLSVEFERTILTSVNCWIHLNSS